MAKGRRRRIPRRIEEEALFRADHTCCICHVKGKHVQIHHIDGNSSNNSYDNLAVVCLDCHSKITGASGLGKAFRPGEVRRYKRAWDQQVQDSRQVHRPRIAYKRELISQIDLIICEILACQPTNPRIKDLLNVLYELNLWRGNVEIRSKIRDGLSHLALMSGLDSDARAPLVAAKLWEICWHFAGPRDVPMDRGDKKHVLECIEALNTLAQFNCEFGRGERAVRSTTEYSENFFEVGVWYSKTEIMDAVIKGYMEALKASSVGKPAFPYGRKVLLRSVRRVLKMLEGEKKKWVYQQRKLQSLLERNR